MGTKAGMEVLERGHFRPKGMFKPDWVEFSRRWNQKFQEVEIARRWNPGIICGGCDQGPFRQVT